MTAAPRGQHSLPGRSKALRAGPSRAQRESYSAVAMWALEHASAATPWRTSWLVAAVHCRDKTALPAAKAPARPRPAGCKQAKLASSVACGLDLRLITHCPACALQGRLLGPSPGLSNAFHNSRCNSCGDRHARRAPMLYTYTCAKLRACCQPLGTTTTRRLKTSLQRNNRRSATAKRSALAHHLEQGVH